MGAEDIAIYYILCSLHVCRHKIEYVFLARLIAKAWRSNLTIDGGKYIPEEENRNDSVITILFTFSY